MLQLKYLSYFCILKIRKFVNLSTNSNGTKDK